MKWRMLFAIAVHLADAVMTYIGLQRGFPEGNQIVAEAITALGFVPAMCLLKGMAIALSYLLIYMNTNESICIFWVATIFTLIFGPLMWALLIFVVH